MRLVSSSTCVRACSSLSLPLSTSWAVWASVTLRAAARPVRTSSSVTSLRITGTPAAAIVCAIWPPIVPAPTTAALKTNMGSCCSSAAATRGSRRLSTGVLCRCQPLLVAQLDGEAPQRALERLPLRPADEHEVDHGQEALALLELVVELERDLHAALVRREDDALGAADLLVLDPDGLPAARLVGHHALDHAAAAAGVRVPQHARAGPRPLALDRGDVLEPV